MQATLDMLPFVLALGAAGILGGLLAGLLGVGGGIVIVPVLFSMLETIGVETQIAIKVAVATSLATIVFTSLSSARSHHKRGAVDKTILRQWVPPIVVGVIIGTAVAGFASGKVMTAVFGIIALIVAANLLLRRGKPALWDGFPSAGVRTFWGCVVGLFSSMMGIGGGTLSVPILTTFGFDMHKAVGTASSIGFIIAIPATLGYIVTGWNASELPPFSLGYVNLAGFIALVPLTAAFAPLGARMAHAISRSTLQVAFGVFLLATSLRMFWSLFS